MSENTQNQNPKQEQYSLNDDRRVKVLSPGALVAKRFFRNRLAVVGLSILVAMFLFSFVGGLVSPYGQDEQFFTYTQMSKEFVGVTRNDTMRFVVADGQNFGSIAQSKALEAVKKGNTEFNYKDVDYTVDIQSDDFYVVYQGRDIMGYASRDLVNEADGAPKFSFDVKLAALTAMTAGEKEFAADGVDYTLDADGNILAGGEELGYVSRLVVSAADSSVVVTRDFKNRLEEAIDDNAAKFNYTDAEGNEAEYDIVYDASTKVWSVKQMTETYVYDRYAAPSKEHWLGTDTNGMDMLTRLMYGGRVSLIIGFIVVVIEASLGILMGGISGYFGGWIDNIIMRIVDVFYCIPSMPVIIIIGAAMDAMRVDSWKRMMYLMLILGFLGWPSIARLVRGQILSLREQEYVLAAQATGAKGRWIITRHLVPNCMSVIFISTALQIPNAIFTESFLSYLGLGVNAPMPSLGSLASDALNGLTSYPYRMVIPALVISLIVLSLNLFGDGLRDAFDPKLNG